jgi:hypothetical protein
MPPGSRIRPINSRLVAILVTNGLVALSPSIDVQVERLLVAGKALAAARRP